MSDLQELDTSIDLVTENKKPSFEFEAAWNELKICIETLEQRIENLENP